MSNAKEGIVFIVFLLFAFLLANDLFVKSDCLKNTNFSYLFTSPDKFHLRANKK